MKYKYYINPHLLCNFNKMESTTLESFMPAVFQTKHSDIETPNPWSALSDKVKEKPVMDNDIESDIKSDIKTDIETYINHHVDEDIKTYVHIIKENEQYDIDNIIDAIEHLANDETFFDKLCVRLRVVPAYVVKYQSIINSEETKLRPKLLNKSLSFGPSKTTTTVETSSKLANTTSNIKQTMSKSSSPTQEIEPDVRQAKITPKSSSPTQEIEPDIEQAKTTPKQSDNNDGFIPVKNTTIKSKPKPKIDNEPIISQELKIPVQLATAQQKCIDYILEKIDIEMLYQYAMHTRGAPKNYVWTTLILKINSATDIIHRDNDYEYSIVRFLKNNTFKFVLNNYLLQHAKKYKKNNNIPFYCKIEECEDKINSFKITVYTNTTYMLE